MRQRAARERRKIGDLAKAIQSRRRAMHDRAELTRTYYHHDWKTAARKIFMTLLVEPGPLAQNDAVFAEGCR
jgi:hypothetical protein